MWHKFFSLANADPETLERRADQMHRLLAPAAVDDPNKIQAGGLISYRGAVQLALLAGDPSTRFLLLSPSEQVQASGGAVIVGNFEDPQICGGTAVGELLQVLKAQLDCELYLIRWLVSNNHEAHHGRSVLKALYNGLNQLHPGQDVVVAASIQAGPGEQRIHHAAHGFYLGSGFSHPGNLRDEQNSFVRRVPVEELGLDRGVCGTDQLHRLLLLDTADRDRRRILMAPAIEKIRIIDAHRSRQPISS